MAGLTAHAARPAQTANAMATSRIPPRIRILYIGNSAIYFHNFPDIVKSLAASGPDPIDIESTMVAEGGQTLEGHWLEGKALRQIRDQHWDYVVLQEQSTLGDDLRIDGISCIRGWESYQRFVKMFDSEAKAVGAKTVILSLWNHKGTPAREQQALDYASQSVARETGAILVPAGSVWHAMERRDPKIDLFHDDFHPTRTASYMFAITFIAAVFHKNPDSLAARATGTDIDIDQQSTARADVVLADVPKLQADEIKQTAYGVVRRGAREVARPAEPATPKLRQGRAATNDDFVGAWSGTENLLSAEPTPITLDISSRGEDLLANVGLGLKPPVEEKAIQGGLAGNVVWFDDPKGVDGSFIRYRGVLVQNDLKGVTELWLQNKLIAIGTFSAHRTEKVGKQ